MERYVVSNGKASGQVFYRKGLAFAYVTRKVKGNGAAALVLQREVLVGKTWLITDTWTYHPNGAIDHTRPCP